jgi:hypothetical protein
MSDEQTCDDVPRAQRTLRRRTATPYQMCASGLSRSTLPVLALLARREADEATVLRAYVEPAAGGGHAVEEGGGGQGGLAEWLA